MAIKFHEDSYYNNTFYSLVGGVSLSELNYLEAEMLSLLRFNLHVHPSHYSQYFRILSGKSAFPEDFVASQTTQDMNDTCGSTPPH